MREGQTVIFNFGLVEHFSTAFYRCLLKVRAVLAARDVRLLLCRLNPELQQVFRLFEGFRLFRVTTTEGRAIQEATAREGVAGEEGTGEGR